MDGQRNGTPIALCSMGQQRLGGGPMFFPFRQTESTVNSLVHEGPLGWKPGRRGDCLPTGTILNGCYRIEEPLDRDGTRRLYAVSPVRGDGPCHFCGLKIGETHNPLCPHCGAELGGKIFQMEVFPGQMDPGLIRKLLKTSHPGVVQTYDTFSVGSNTHLVSEYIRGATLDRLEGILTAQQIRMAGICLTQTVEFLHGQGICHMSLQPRNLKLVGDSPRLISLSACRLKSNLPEKCLDRCDREDFGELLETLEKLAAEYIDQSQGDMLCRLLLALEEMIGRDDLSAGKIREALALLWFEPYGKPPPHSAAKPQPNIS